MGPEIVGHPSLETGRSPPHSPPPAILAWRTFRGRSRDGRDGGWAKEEEQATLPPPLPPPPGPALRQEGTCHLTLLVSDAGMAGAGRACRCFLAVGCASEGGPQVDMLRIAYKSANSLVLAPAILAGREQTVDVGSFMRSTFRM